MHTMRNGDDPDETVADAERAATNYINTKLEEAVNLQSRFILNGGSGYDEQALEHLGHALHTATDATSPQHAGYQPWYGQNDPGGFKHIHDEGNAASSSRAADVEARHQAHVAAAAIKLRFEAVVKKRTQPPKPPKKKKRAKTPKANATSETQI